MDTTSKIPRKVSPPSQDTKDTVKILRKIQRYGEWYPRPRKMLTTRCRVPKQVKRIAPSYSSKFDRIHPTTDLPFRRLVRKSANPILAATSRPTQSRGMPHRYSRSFSSSRARNVASNYSRYRYILVEALMISAICKSFPSSSCRDTNCSPTDGSVESRTS